MQSVFSNSLVYRCIRMFWLLWLSVVFAAATSANAAGPIPFVAPKDRALAVTEQAWPVNSFVTLAYHDVQDVNVDQRFLGVSSANLVAQFAWLRENGYRPVSVDQILAARDGGPLLPAKAILLTFDDGYSSFYHRVFPLLKATGWPAVLAPVGVWMDTAADKSVDFGGLATPRGLFADWRQITEMAASGLVEVGAHTDDLHFGAPANPQGNTQPAAATRIYDVASGAYETDEVFNRRLEADVASITAKIKSVTGKLPRVWVWPYGAANGNALEVVRRNGYQLALTLDDGLGRVDNLLSTPRVLIANDPDVSEFGRSVIAAQNSSVLRVAHVDLDYVYDADPVQLARNFDQLIQRIYDLRINTVFLQAFSDPKGDGNIHSLYFPNRWLPVRADLFNRAAWQLRTRARVAVYAWMPVLAFDLDPALPRIQRWNAKTNTADVDTGQYRRLSPFDSTVRSRITDMYEDLARHSWFDGLLFHDDALMSDYEDVSPVAMAAYRAAGLPGSVDVLRADPAMLQRWTRFKSRFLVDFTSMLSQRVKAIRGPQVKTARNIFASPIIDPASETWFSQNLDDFLTAYDWTAPMAMPLMENVADSRTDAWLDSIVDTVSRRPGALDRTVFEVQAVDWRKETAGPVPSEKIAHWLRRLQLRGARSVGYYPDDFAKGSPDVQVIRPALSRNWFPKP